MGYSIMSYLTDAGTLRGIYGSKNIKLGEELCDEWQEELVDLDRFFELSSGKAQQVVEDFIQGQIRFKELAFLYGYVYELFCRKWGEEVFPDSEEYETQFLEDLTKEYSAFLPIPFSGDFPHIVSIEHAQLQDFATKCLSRLKGEQREEFASVIEEARERGKDLVFFNY